MIKFTIFYSKRGYCLIKVALFGGSFDPPHAGHQSIVKSALDNLAIDRLILLPAFLNPFKISSLAPPSLRLAWCRELFGGDGRVEVSDYEVLQDRPVTTAESLGYFQKLYDVKYIIIGADNLATIEKWHSFEWLNTQIVWAIATRSGYEVESAKLQRYEVLAIDHDISSTNIREQGDLSQVDRLIAPDVASTIKQSKLHKGNT